MWLREDGKTNRENTGPQKTAWERIKVASGGTKLSLTSLHGLSDDMLAHVSTMSHLKSIDLDSSSGFSAEGIKHLYMLPRLETLDLNNTKLDDSALEGIGSIVGLKHLYLHRTNVTDAGLPHFAHFSFLRKLRLSKCKGVTNAGMVHVGRLTGIEKLWLRGTAVTDDGLQQLTALTKLRTLQLPNGNMVNDEDVHRWIGRR
ncbi:unnamed protein product [Closterium sp. Yama58-4]|nr:unnamed protein product [Closterium sp. Yama58-4]